MLKNYLFSPLYSAPFLCSNPLFLFLSAPHTSFSFSVSWSAAPFFLLFSSRLLFLFYRSVALYFSAQNTFFLAQTFFSILAQKHFFQPKTFFSSAQNVFFFFFSQFSHSSVLLFFCRHVALLSSAFYFFSASFFFFSLAPFI